MATRLKLATALEGEKAQLQSVIETMSDHSLKRQYANWLTEHDDPRGAFLNSVLDQWDAGSGELPADESLDIVWQRTCGITLLQTLRSVELDNFEKLLTVARPALMLNPTTAEGDVPVGTSKFGGHPDLPADQAWPEFNDELLMFLGQINLSELSDTQVASQLPEKGMLSFFIHDDEDEGHPAPDGEAGSWKVIFTPNTSALQRHDPPKEFSSGNFVTPECCLEFEETLDMPYTSLYDLDQDYADQMIGCRRAKQLGLAKGQSDEYESVQAALMSDREERSHLLGWSHPQVVCDDPIDEDCRNLLTLASEELCAWCWADGHQLYFGIKEEDLISQNFENTTALDG